MVTGVDADARGESLKKRLVDFWNSREVYWDPISTSEAAESPQREKAASFLPEGGEKMRMCGRLRRWRRGSAGHVAAERVNGHLGFRDGVHFVGYRKKEEINDLVRTYLANERARRAIAAAGQELVLSDRRVGTFLELGCALAELPAIAQRSLAKALAGSVVIARAWGRQIPGRIRKRLARATGLDGSKA